MVGLAIVTAAAMGTSEYATKKAAATRHQLIASTAAMTSVCAGDSAALSSPIVSRRKLNFKAKLESSSSS
jgi:hypothetical protein